MNSANNSTEMLSEIIGLIYEAAADLTLWPKLLETLSDYLELSFAPIDKNSAPHAPLTQSEHSLINSLAPHFKRAHAIHQQLAEAVEERNLLERVMNRLPLGAAIIDFDCNAISLNNTITALIQSSELLKLSSGRLVSSPPNLLEQAVEKLLTEKVNDISLRLSNAESNLSIWIKGGNLDNAIEGAPNRLMIFVASRTIHALSEQGLQTLYELTPAEAKITQQIALGGNLEEVADELSISRNTAKSQLARVFKKVGVKRQAELMQAIYASPLWFKPTIEMSSQMSTSPSNLQLKREAYEDQKLRLADGRNLYFSDCGDPNGHPVIFMHGIAGSRYLRHPDDDILLQTGIRLIIPERPGSGDSDPKTDRKVIDWPADVRQLVEHLDIQQFTVLGYSAGTSYALAVAAALPEKIKSVQLVAAVPPISDMKDLRAFNPVFRMSLYVARYTQGLLPAMMRLMVKDIRKNVYQYLEKIFADAPEQDRAILSNPKLRANIAHGLRASVKKNEAEIAHEVLLTSRDWEIDLNKINSPTTIWFGTKDPLVSPIAAKTLAQLLPNAALSEIPEAGHYLLYSHWAEILSTIKAKSQLPYHPLG
jgi:pimeloyl-ACP methyl ester carboxylesterase/DNA-binding CsgD family transcriptional regulator